MKNITFKSQSLKYLFVKISKLITIVPILIIFPILQNLIIAQKINPIKLTWLGKEPPSIATGVSWGVPLPEGKINRSLVYSLKSQDGKILPLQSWPLAYWPDGSIKWIGLSTIVDTNSGKIFELIPNEKSEKNYIDKKISIVESSQNIIINNGNIQCEIPRKGNDIIKIIKLNGKIISEKGSLVCILQNGPNREIGTQPTKEKYIGEIEKVKIEQNGPIRAVIKIEGRHLSENGIHSWLPFIVRLYFYAGQQSIRMVHTIVYDGDQNKDFIRGLGLVFDVPMNEQLYNRHIRFSGDEGRLWDEPCEPLNGRIPFYDNGEDLYAKQLKGEKIAERETFSEKHQFLLDNWASWNDFKLEQLNADGFQIQKRTNIQSAWIDAGYGKRSEGMAFVGDVSGGLTVCVKDFWQSYPTSIEIKNVKSDKAELKVWLWSPEASEMDMRHYDTLAWGHSLEASYEDVQPGFSTANGVSRTSEILLYVSENVPSHKTLKDIAKLGNQTTLLTVSSEYIHSIPVFGVWSLPDSQKLSSQWIESQLNNAFKYYNLEVEQRHWYGFWNYGDVQHGYDPERHSWKYDMGGYAWDNTELMPNLWLWYSYLRTGRNDIFKMAEAMTRHTGEVDVYHIGKFKGLGSRHNVRHWGCGAKEVRIAQAALGRFYYYLTTDERTGDLMHDAVEASNEAIGNLDPVRLIMEKSQYPTHARVGPDWLALVGNWMTEWERTGDEKYRERILVGVNSLAEMPYGLFSGNNAAFGYDPQTYKLYRLDSNDIGFLHLSVLMGGPEIAFELSHLLKNNKWDKLWLQFCKLYSSPQEIIEKEFGKKIKLGDPGPWFARLPAYYSKMTNNKEYAKRAWDDLLNVGGKRYHTDFNLKLFDEIESLQPIYEIEGVSTNNTAQWCLNAIELLELIGDDIPEGITQKIELKNSIKNYQKDQIIYYDNFETGLKNWVAENSNSPNSLIETKNGKLIIDVDSGATVWFKKSLSGNILIEYNRSVVIKNGKNDRLSDLNQFWMATDPYNKDLFTRNGNFAEYDSLKLYYAGIGGNSNSTTRFRKYLGNGERKLLCDYNDEEHMIKPNKNYLIQIIVYNGTTEVYVDGELYYSLNDDNPLTNGFFGFRTVKSHQEIDNFKVYGLK